VNIGNTALINRQGLHVAAAKAERDPLLMQLVTSATPGTSLLYYCRFFQQRWRLLLCTGSEQLNRDFTLVLRGGAYVLLASSVPVRRDGPGPAAAGTAAGAAGAEAPAVAPSSPTEGGLPQAAVARDGVLAAPTGPATAADWAAYAADQSPAPEGDAPSGLQGGRSASSDLCEAVTFHVVGGWCSG